MNVQQLQPTFTQSQFTKTQSEDNQTVSQDTEKNTNQSAETNNQSTVNALNQTSISSIPVIVKGWNQTNQAPVEEETEPVIDISTDDAFIGGTCLRLEADVVHSNFIKYR
jgi:hypothetical protein